MSQSLTDEHCLQLLSPFTAAQGMSVNDVTAFLVPVFVLGVRDSVTLL